LLGLRPLRHHDGRCLVRVLPGQAVGRPGAEESVALLLQLGIERREADQAASHLTALLQVKNQAEYEERLLGRGDSDRAMKHLDRFKAWAREKLP